MQEHCCDSKVLSRLSGEESDFIEVPENFLVKQGEIILEGVYIGPLLGAGLQGQVYQLNLSNGDPTGWVLKAVASTGSAAVASRLFPAMVREWAVGRLLVKALDGGDKNSTCHSGALAGFMRTGAAILSSGRGPTFRGLVLEHMSGQTMDKRLRSREFGQQQDIHYIRQMLQQVFTSLAAARQRAGFRHWDLRLANIMDHSQDAPAVSKAHPLAQHSQSADGCGTAATSASSQASSCFKMIDLGHAQVKLGKLRGPMAGIRVPAIPVTERSYRLFWVYKRDVYRLLMSLQNVLDGSSFPAQDADDVRQLTDLIHHVTGVRMKLYLGGLDETRQLCSMPWDTPASEDGHSGFFRLLLIRMQSFVMARHPSISAAKALRHPFFTSGNRSKA